MPEPFWAAGFFQDLFLYSNKSDLCTLLSINNAISQVKKG